MSFSYEVWAFTHSASSKRYSEDTVLIQATTIQSSRLELEFAEAFVSECAFFVFDGLGAHPVPKLASTLAA